MNTKASKSDNILFIIFIVKFTKII